MVSVILEYLKALNNSKFFAGLVMIMLNIGSKYVTIELSKNREKVIAKYRFKLLDLIDLAHNNWE